MVIVKHEYIELLQYCQKKFTCQYGYNKTEIVSEELEMLDKFTFQYGYNKTLETFFVFQKPKPIYIPIWL